MDHLSWRHTERSRPRVPFLCAHLRDEQICSNAEEFGDWPQKQGWNLDDNSSPLQIATLCQSWLFFGLIRIVFQDRKKHFSLRDFVTDEESTTLNTSQLVNVFDYFRLIELLLPRIPRGLFMPLYLASTWISTALQRCESGFDSSDGWSFDLFQVFWSTSLLWEQVSKDYEYKTLDQPKKDISRTVSSSLHTVEMIKSLGRCPYVVLRNSLSLMDLWDVISTPLVPIEFQTEQQATHASCDAHQCDNARNTAVPYQKKHSPTCPTVQFCNLIGVDSDILERLLQEGAVPVVRSTIGHTGRVCIDLVDGSEREFTAISHVWAGGLGNPATNEIYECQARYLHEMLYHGWSWRTSSTVYYWLDTLCVPVDDKHLKKRAIDDMAFIYARASEVVVLDPVLQHIREGDLTTHQQKLMIVSSPWNCRAWTFQEGALAVNLRFQFQGTTKSISHLDDFTAEHTDHQTPSMYKRDVDRLADKLPKHVASPAERLATIWYALSRRSSSQVEDIAAIIALFIDRSAGEILALPRTKRVHALLRSCIKLPTSSLFLPVEDAEEWRPKLPAYEDNVAMLQTITFLEFIDDNCLRITDFGELYILHCSAPLPSSSLLTICDSLAQVYFELYFLHERPPSLYAGAVEFLFVMPRGLVDTEGRPTGRCLGLCFHTGGSSDLDDHIVHFWNCFEFRKVSKPTEATDAVAGPSRRVGSSTVFGTPFPPQRANEDVPEYTLLLDMGVQDWPALTWTRKQYYPFISYTVQAVRPLKLLFVMPILPLLVFASAMMTWALVSVIEGFAVTHKYRSVTLKFILGESAIILPAVCYFGLCIIENWHRESLIRASLQRTWSSSFTRIDGTSANGTPHQMSLRNLFCSYLGLSMTLLAIGPVYRSGLLREHNRKLSNFVFPEIAMDDSITYGQAVVCATFLPYLSLLLDIHFRILFFITLGIFNWITKFRRSIRLEDDAEIEAELGRADIRWQWGGTAFYLTCGLLTWGGYISLVVILSTVPVWFFVIFPPTVPFALLTGGMFFYNAYLVSQKRPVYGIEALIKDIWARTPLSVRRMICCGDDTDWNNVQLLQREF